MISCKKTLILALAGVCLVHSSGTHAAKKSKSSESWVDLALRLTGESEAVYNNSVRKLRALPNLEDLLRDELHGENRALALDVITNLGLTQMLPDLVEISKSDGDGFVYLTLNSLINEDNARQVADLYVQRISDFTGLNTPSPSARVAMIDTLGRMQLALPVSLLNRLISDSSFEVRQSVVTYLRPLLLKLHRDEYLPILGKALAAHPYQLRLEALYLVAALRNSDQKKLRHAVVGCTDDEVDVVRTGCRFLLKRIPLGAES